MGLVSELVFEVVTDTENEVGVNVWDTLGLFDIICVRDDDLLDHVGNTFCKLIRNKNQVANVCVVLSIILLKVESQNKYFLEIPGDGIDSGNDVVLMNLN